MATYAARISTKAIYLFGTKHYDQNTKERVYVARLKSHNVEVGAPVTLEAICSFNEIYANPTHWQPAMLALGLYADL